MNKHSSLLTKASLIIMVACLVGGMVWLALPTGTAAAASNPQGTTTSGTSQNTDENGPQGALRLQRLFRLEKRTQQAQERNLNRADKLVEKVSALIEKLREQGRDVAPLEQALAAFNESVATATDFHQQAADIISTHPGFDDDGKVIDLALARQTVKDIKDLQVQFHQTIQPAFRELIQALREYRRNNPPKQTDQD
jgi:hypothetical protein